MSFRYTSLRRSPPGGNTGDDRHPPHRRTSEFLHSPVTGFQRSRFKSAQSRTSEQSNRGLYRVNQYRPRTRSNLPHSTAQFCMSSQSALNHHGAIRYRRRSSKDIVPMPEAAPGVGVPILIAMLVTLFNVTPKVAKSCKGMTHCS